MKTDEIRRLYLDFFKSKAHVEVASDSLVPKDDPTLLFTGAGMNQFKEKFLGRNLTYRRATSSQKCLRTGDLENVGRTPRHHTFFEMLGNFSFGDYFKREAIGWAWEFLVERLRLKVDRLWVSVYKDDDEAYGIWRDDIKVPAEKIVKFGSRENFWPSEAPAKGPNGPCGPCSEIYYDYGKEVGCGKPDCTPECDCGRFVEVWNLVFTQFDRQPDGGLKNLPNKNIDTGMGLERLASVIQGVNTNFEIDIFVPIVKAIESYGGVRKATSEVGGRGSAQGAARSRVNAIADHIRAVTFCISDGVMPSNEERGYVVRKLIRRAMSHANELGIREPFLYKLVSAVTEAMGAAYPEVAVKRDDIAQIVKKEEEGFLVVISSQLPKVEAAFEDARRARAGRPLAETAFNFYDTYGMPYEMLEELAEKHGLRIDRAEFERHLEKQRAQSRSRSKIKGEIFSETFAKKVEALGLKTEFVGYEESRSDAKVVAVMEGGEIILDRTPFYGESGGQAGDRGTIETASALFRVKDAKKIADAIVHICEAVKGEVSSGDSVKAAIDEEVRRRVMANHTATHLLQAALRKVLGDHVRQTGSLVDSEHLRFDFTHMKKMAEREIERVEELVNENIKRAISVKKEVKDIGSARREGATALFGEKYDEMVRVVTVGDVSKELCGGTHVGNTADIGSFKITGESSIASGVRRIEALTGDAALSWIEERRRLKDEKAKAEAKKAAEEERASKRIEEESARLDDFISRARRIGAATVVIERLGDVGMEGLRVIADKVRKRVPSGVTILVTGNDDKISFIVSATADLAASGLTASAIAKEMALCVDGSAGGKDTFAQGGGKSPAKLDGAVEKALKFIKERLS
jgi:alanyl-tRNA synthetase